MTLPLFYAVSLTNITTVAEHGATGSSVTGTGPGLGATKSTRDNNTKLFVLNLCVRATSQISCGPGNFPVLFTMGSALRPVVQTVCMISTVDNNFLGVIEPDGKIYPKDPAAFDTLPGLDIRIAATYYVA